MKYGFLVFGLFAVACGAQDGSLPADLLATPTPSTPVAEIDPQVQAKSMQKMSTTPVESQLVSMAYNLAVELPECTVEREGVLAYVKDEKTFYTCSSLNWDVIDVSGKAGKDGVDGQSITGQVGPTGARGADGQSITGPAGIAGRDGRDGSNGSTGATGLQGIQGERGIAGESVTGPQGPVGATGAQGSVGATGSAGQNAVTNKISERWVCSNVLPMGAIFNSTWSWTYIVSKTSVGDVYASVEMYSGQTRVFKSLSFANSEPNKDVGSISIEGIDLVNGAGGAGTLNFYLSSPEIPQMTVHLVDFDINFMSYHNSYSENRSCSHVTL